MKTFNQSIIFIESMILLYCFTHQISLGVLFGLILIIASYAFQDSYYQMHYLIYILFAYFFGCLLRFYQYNYYDKIIHFYSGLLISTISYYLIKNEIKTKRIHYLFMNSLTIFIGVLWEFLEYSALVFLQYDAMHQYDTGVHDTMCDLLVMFIAALCITMLLDKHPSCMHDFDKSQQDILKPTFLGLHI